MADRQGAPTDLSPAGQDAWRAVRDSGGGSTAPGSHTAQLVEIHGDLDLAMLGRAVAQVVAEAAALRVRFAGEGPDGLPALETADDLPLPVVDLSTEADPRGAADAWAHAALERRSEETGQPWSTQALLRLGPDRHRWFHRHHRAVVDRFGCALITRRVSEVYTALTEGRSTADGALATRAQLPSTAAGYAGSPAQEAGCAQRRRHVADLPEPVTFASAPARDIDGPRAPVNSRPVTLATTDTERVRATARYSGVRARAVLAAAVAAYAHRLSGATDVVIGMPVDGRPSRVSRRVPDTSENIVPLRLAVRSATTFAELVQDVARESREAVRHQRLGHGELCRGAGAPGDRRRLFGPIADIRAPKAPVRFGELSAVVHDLAPDPVHDVRVVLDDDPANQRLRVVFSGAADRYSTAELDAHARRFVRLLSLAVAAPGHPLGTFDLLAADERATVRSWTSGTASRAPGRTLTDLLESAARSHPDAVAVIDAEDKLTYAQLHERANRLARLLLGRGAGPESVVGLLLPRSAETLVAMLAVLKTGAAYLPLDPGYPAERLRFMIEDAEPFCVLTGTDSDVVDGASRSTTAIRLDDPAIAEELERCSPTAPSDADRPEPLRPSHPAYVIYTSGSSGTPKGVVVPHRGVVALVDWVAAEFGPESLAHTLAATSFSFDVSVAEIFPALAGGGSVEVVGSLLSLLDSDPPRWSGGLLCAIPSVFSKLTETGGLQVSATTLSMAGDALPASLVAQIRESMPGTRLLNLYGPTEATVYATAATVHDPASTGDGPVPEGAPPIGRPAAHVRAYVLDSALQQVEAGRQGELYLAGECLARGYLRRAGLSAERFVADPFGPPGERMYRTGDLARWRPDGLLAFLGRADAQVKVNGFRVELGEVETVLARHPAVTEVMAAVRKGTSGDARLVAFLVPADGARFPDHYALRDWAAERLPAHLVPAELKAATALPRTGSGKLDREKPPTGVRPLTAGPPVAQEPPEPVPGTASGAEPAADGSPEEQVARVFREVLRVPEVATDVSFFDLGGDSIMSIQLVSRLRQVGLALTPQDILEHKTVRALARTVRETNRTNSPDAGATAGLRPAVTSLRQWSIALSEQARSPERQAELPLWQDILATSGPLRVKRPFDPSKDVPARARSNTMTYGADRARHLFSTVPAAFHCETSDVLLTAFAVAVQHVLGTEEDVVVDVEGHDRAPVAPGADLSRTVGCFTSAYPLRLAPGKVSMPGRGGSGAELGQALRRVKEQLRAIPDKGIGFGMLRYLNPRTSAALSTAEPRHIGFTYLGRFSLPAATDEEDWGTAPEVRRDSGVGADLPPAHPLSVSALVQDTARGPELGVTFVWADGTLDERLVDEIGAAWFALLDELATPPEARDDTAGTTWRGIQETSESGMGVLLPLRESGDKAPLFCVHPAAGFSWCYAGLTSPLGADRPVYGLQARGLDGTEALPASLREMAADYLAHVRSVQPAGPYHLLGWSFGGVVAHEMAVQLEESGESVETLAILDAYPAGSDVAGAAASAEAAPGSVAGRDVLAMLLEFFGYDPSPGAGESLTYPQFVEITRAREGMLASFDEQQIAALARTFTHNARVAGLHEPRPFGGDTVMFTAQGHAPETALGLWRPLIKGSLEVLPVDCTHTEMGRPAALRDIGRVLVEQWASKAPQKGR
ncbi:amino acid adenylation domain-containing protein [Streptomyces sp. NPDC001219]